MRSFTHCWWRSRLVAALLFAALVPVAQAASASTTARAASERTECLGYYTANLPGEFEYALTTNYDARLSNFADRLGAWGTEIRLDLIGLQSQEVAISQPAGNVELMRRMEARNAQQQRERDQFLELANRIEERVAESKETDPDGQERKAQRDQANRVSFVKKLSGREGIFLPTKDKIELHALVNGHILSTELKPLGTPEQTLDALLSHYKPRALGEVPNGPGVCVPYGFFTGEKQPATIGLNIRLKDQPDIVVYLLARDAATDAPDDPGKLLDGLTPTSTFFGSRRVMPIHKFNPLRSIKIDGSEGLGSFVRVTRKAVADQSRAFNNAAENDEDWGYFAYIPGLGGGKPGASFNLTFKVERFGRFAKQPMTESQFRELVLSIAASIKRRPGAWVQN